MKKLIKDQQKRLDKFEAQQKKYAIKRIEQARKEAQKQLEKELSELANNKLRSNKSLNRINMRISSIDNIYGELKKDLRELNASTTDKAIQKGLFDVNEYAYTASKKQYFISDGLLSALTPKVDKQVLKSLGSNYLAYLDKHVDDAKNKLVKQSKLITIKEFKLIQEEIDKGVILGDGREKILRNIKNNIEKQSSKDHAMLKARAKRHVGITLNRSYNESKFETIKELANEIPEMGKMWLSRLHNTTPICLELHGQVVKANENFKFSGGWEGKAPPAIGDGANPVFHVCHSTIVPHSSDWDKSEKLKAQEKAIKEGIINSNTDRLTAVKIND